MLFSAKSNGIGPEEALIYTQVRLVRCSSEPYYTERPSYIASSTKHSRRTNDKTLRELHRYKQRPGGSTVPRAPISVCPTVRQQALLRRGNHRTALSLTRRILGPKSTVCRSQQRTHLPLGLLLHRVVLVLCLRLCNNSDPPTALSNRRQQWLRLLNNREDLNKVGHSPVRRHKGRCLGPCLRTVHQGCLAIPWRADLSRALHRVSSNLWLYQGQVIRIPQRRSGRPQAHPLRTANRREVSQACPEALVHNPLILTKQ